MEDDIVVPVVEPVVDDFDSAFAQASEPTSAPVTPAPEPAPVAALDAADVVADTPADKVEPVAAPTAEAAAAALEVASAAPAAPVPAPAAPASQPSIDPAFLAQAIAEANERTRVAAEATAASAPAPYVPATADTFMTDAHRAAVNKFKTEWPEEFPAIEAMVAAQAQALVANAQYALVTQLNGVLAPLFQSTEKAEVNSHMSVIRSAHPDLDTILGAVPQWVAAQPSFLQPKLNEILEKGNAQEVVGLLNMYKQASVGQSAAPVTPASPAAQETKPAPKPRTAVDPAAVAATAAVPATQRSASKLNSDPNDFDSAFDEALKQTS